MRIKKKKKLPYGGIKNITLYLEKKYKGKPVMVDRGKTLIINRQSMQEITGRKANNCTLVAISRILMYYRIRMHKTNIDRSIGDIYRKVEAIGTEYGYTDARGVVPIFVDDIVEEAFEMYGYKVKCKGHYIWSFEKQVKREIAAGRPVIMNIARGFYKNHTVTVIGYRIYSVTYYCYSMIFIKASGNVHNYRSSRCNFSFYLFFK